jgi:hypothetical protein
VQVQREVLACQVLDRGEQVVAIFEHGVCPAADVLPQENVTSPVPTEPVTKAAATDPAVPDVL